MCFFDRVSTLCKERGTSPSAVAREIGLNNSSATYWKRGSIPKGDTLQKLADYFGVSVDYLLGNDEERPMSGHVTDDFSVRLLEAAANLSEADRRLVLDMAMRLRDAGGGAAAVKTTRGPYYLYGYPDSAGTPVPTPQEDKDTTAAKSSPESAEDGE